ncbi:MAG TPA: GNAT family N-acetyltransferase [Thermaerobacter sp.]
MARLPPAFELVPVPYEDKSVLANLMQLYKYDLSVYDDDPEDRDVNAHGLFTYRYLDHYWTEPGRYPFFVRVEGKLAGFVLVCTHGERCEVAEFFVLKRYRRLGLGEAVARELFRRFPGPWRVAVMAANLPAQAFWRRVLGRLAPGGYREAQEPGWDGPVFLLEVNGAAPGAGDGAERREGGK